MYYLKQVIKQFEVPTLKLIKLKFTGPDEMLTIWEDPNTQHQYALWWRDYMVGVGTEKLEIQKLADLTVDEPMRVKTEFWEPNVDPQYRDERDFYCTSPRGFPGFEYMLFSLPQGSRQVSEAIAPTLLTPHAYSQILTKFNVLNPTNPESAYQLIGTEYQDEDYLLTRWRLNYVGQDYLLLQSWFLLAPQLERLALQNLMQISPGRAVPKPKEARYPQKWVEDYAKGSRVADAKTHQKFLLFEAE